MKTHNKTQHLYSKCTVCNWEQKKNVLVNIYVSEYVDEYKEVF